MPPTTHVTTSTARLDPRWPTIMQATLLGTLVGRERRTVCVNARGVDHDARIRPSKRHSGDRSYPHTPKIRWSDHV